ncbi:hypothetical protein ASPVEDRAFT_89472 [Aspergillus versicolor CBS 583.65]|uniref:Serpin domain-containing protein n=1 Tax=Aspergillus versicolor CBS 583.65 TaxID=1036611 RepID=A0A1L9Q3F1_ASPVE|nr:uncharacterized protein ASPVEDRAFT_89472 [Aspergillus versicolor CBS 583.65]OJJ08242.1 hypothetical protein ASPVEDRAFT_89472 [Aspergillus versicolor CBS 583.65]
MDIAFDEVVTIPQVSLMSWQLLQFLWSSNPPPGGTAVSPISMATAICILRRLAYGEPPTNIDYFLRMFPSFPTVTYKKGIFALNGLAFSLPFSRAVSRYGSMMVFRDPSSLENTISEIDKYFMSGDPNGSIDMKLSPESLAASRDATSASSHVVLAKAVMISLPFHHLFPPSAIGKSTFNLLDGTTAQIDMMHCANEQLLVKNEAEYTAVRLPFGPPGHPSCSLFAYLPRNGHSVEHLLNDPYIQACRTEGFTKTLVGEFVMPQFHTKARYNLKDILPLLGMPLPQTYPHVGADGDVAVDQILEGVSVVFDPSRIDDFPPAPRPLPQCDMPRMESLSFNSPFVFAIEWGEQGFPMLCGVFDRTGSD